MVDRLDRYLARTALASYGAALLFMILLFTLVNLLLDLGRFLRQAELRGAGTFELLGELVWYYALFMPVVFVTVAPFVSVIAAMFAVARHMSSNEIAPMLFIGRSMFRVLRPVLATGLASALAMVATWEFVIPEVTEPLHDARQVLEGDEAGSSLEDLVLRSKEGTDRTLIVSAYDHSETRMSGVVLLDRGSGSQDLALVTATAAEWDEDAADWRLVEGQRRTAARATDQGWLGLPVAEPDLLWRLGKEGRETVQLSYSELLDLRELRPGRRDFELALHGHITFPLANLVLMLLALPFAVYFERGGRVERVVFAVLLCAAYLVTDLTCQNLGRSFLHPVLAAWLPTILFGSVGVVFFGGIRT